MHYLPIPHKLTINTSVRNEVIPLNLRNRLVVYHLIYNGLILLIEHTISQRKKIDLKLFF